MKKFCIAIVLMFTLFSFGCTSKVLSEKENKNTGTNSSINQETESGNSIYNDINVDLNSEPDDDIDTDVIDDSKAETKNSIDNEVIIYSKIEPTGSTEDRIYYFDNVFSLFEYPGKKVEEIITENFLKEVDSIPFEGIFINAPVSGKMHLDNSKEEPVIEKIEFVVFEDDLSQDDCQAYLYNTYGALIAEGTEEDTNGQIYWRRYFTGQKILKYSKKAKENFYTITIE